MLSEASREVTTAEAAAFDRDGAVLIKEIPTAECVDRVRARLNAAIASPDVLSESLGALRVDQFSAARSPELRNFIEEPPVAEVVGPVLRSRIRFYVDPLFYKPKRLVPATQWHQDTCYYNIVGHDLIRA